MVSPPSDLPGLLRLAKAKGPEAEGLLAQILMLKGKGHLLDPDKGKGKGDEHKKDSGGKRRF